MLDANRLSEAARVERFQDPEDNPYVERYGAVALVSSPVFDKSEIAATTTSSHPKGRDLTLVVIHGKDMMTLAHTLYRRAADEA
jgi:hypothetical protein